MNKIKLIFVTTAILSVSAFTFIQYDWKVTDTYSVKCSIGKDGSFFKGLKATILFDEDNPAKSKITATIDARTINTGNSAMDAHAREALSTDLFQTIQFESTAITKTSKGYETTGNLTIKGVTKSIKFPFFFDSKKASDQFPFNPQETFKGAFTIVPKDYNITREGTPDQLRIDLIIPVTK